jgi:predicted transcriptional regulator
MNRKINHQVTLKPQDLMVLLKLVTSANKPATYGELSKSLGMSASEVHASVGRARSARLLRFEGVQPVVIRAAFKEFVLHGA